MSSSHLYSGRVLDKHEMLVTKHLKLETNAKYNVMFLTHSALDYYEPGIKQYIQGVLTKSQNPIYEQIKTFFEFNNYGEDFQESLKRFTVQESEKIGANVLMLRGNVTYKNEPVQIGDQTRARDTATIIVCIPDSEYLNKYNLSDLYPLNAASYAYSGLRRTVVSIKDFTNQNNDIVNAALEKLNSDQGWRSDLEEETLLILVCRIGGKKQSGSASRAPTASRSHAVSAKCKLAVAASFMNDGDYAKAHKIAAKLPEKHAVRRAVQQLRTGATSKEVHNTLSTFDDFSPSAVAAELTHAKTKMEKFHPKVGSMYPIKLAEQVRRMDQSNIYGTCLAGI